VLKRLSIMLALAGALFMATAGAASARDSNNDRIPDRWEKRHGLKLMVKQTKRDQDRDGLKNLSEFRAQMDPRDSDSDDDGVQDDDENAGKVKSFEGGVLTITLFAGGEVSGMVTDDTEIDCGDDESDDEHGDDDDENGDDDDEQGDDDDENGDDDDRTATASHDSGDDDDGDDEACPADALAADAIVEEAELKLTASGAVWDEIELR
jgi:hypothetical protein